MSVKPLHDRVLIKRLEEENKTAGGIIIPDNSQEKPARGEVVEAGEGLRSANGDLMPMAVKKGDKVLFEKYGHSEVKIEGQEYLIMRESSILGILG